MPTLQPALNDKTKYYKRDRNRPYQIIIGIEFADGSFLKMHCFRFDFSKTDEDIFIWKFKRDKIPLQYGNVKGVQILNKEVVEKLRKK